MFILLLTEPVSPYITPGQTKWKIQRIKSRDVRNTLLFMIYNEIMNDNENVLRTPFLNLP